MKNSNPYAGDAFRFYKKVCSKKQDAALVTRLRAMDIDIRALYDTYDLHFQANTLESLAAVGYINQHKADLETLYDYKSATFTKLRDQLTTTATGRVVKCQNCTINDISTFDHMVPQGEFAEFIVHPRNLMCCCADCNPRRNNVWRLNGRKTTLNLYLDILPDIQYLFVAANIGNTAIETTFYLQNPNGVDAELFVLLEAHYNRLKLFKRFADGADTVISSLRNIMEPLRAFHDLDETRLIVLETIRRERLAFGHNYWQSVLKLELINNHDFMIDYE